jgi:tight adherence protein C
MNTLLSSIGVHGSDSGIWIFALSAGLAFMLLTWGALTLSAARSDPLRRRLKAVRDEAASASVQPGRLARWLAIIRPYLEPREEERRRGLREQLVQAGLKSDFAMTLLITGKIALLILLPTAVVLVARAEPDLGLTGANLVTGVALAAYVGWLLPKIYVEQRVESRKRRLLEGLPDALDLLVACTEAGLGLNAAIERVAEQIPASHTELGHELRQVNAEIRAGIDRTVALRNLADRTGLEDIRGLVALISHSMRFGTGIADTLRIYAAEFRDRRMQRAEEMAAMVGTKLIFPLCFCIFPAFFVVATGPAILGVLHVLGAGDVVFPGSQ